MNERAFRLLSVVGDQLTNHFDNLKRVMAASLVQSHVKDGASQGGGRASRYIERVAGRGSQISVLKESAPTPGIKAMKIISWKPL